MYYVIWVNILNHFSDTQSSGLEQAIMFYSHGDDLLAYCYLGKFHWFLWLKANKLSEHP